MAAAVGEHGFWDLDQPVVRVGAAHTPVPYQKDLEAGVIPGADDILAAVRTVI